MVSTPMMVTHGMSHLMLARALLSRLFILVRDEHEGDTGQLEHPDNRLVAACLLHASEAQQGRSAVLPSLSRMWLKCMNCSGHTDFSS